jgi:hypothetical protein
MKKLVLLTFLNLISLSLFSQTNFEWQIKDSINKSKSELYSATKQFIAKKWKSANDVIQNDDKEAGIILVKGLTNRYTFVHLGATYCYTYSYDVTFKMKDNKFMIEVNNVKCHNTLGSSFDNKFFIEPNDGCGNNKKFALKCDELLTDLKSQLDNIVSSYLTEIKNTESKTDEW